MLWRIGYSVRSKVLALMLASTLAALLVAGAALIAYDVRTHYERWASDLTTQAEILGGASIAALAFDDRRVARENLDLLRVRPQILAAAIYNTRGELFASYTQAGIPEREFPRPPFGSGVDVKDGDIEIFHRIVENQREQGTVYIRARYGLLGRIADYVSILGLVFGLSLLAAFVMSAWLQRAITRPIADMSQVARHVMESRDFSLRVKKTTRDEIGYLVDAFNDMLAEIGRRSQALLTADRMKDQFLATLAHELRNPLAPISNALHLLEAADGKPEVAAEARRMMARQVKQMVRLVDDLLDVSRITTGKLVLHRELVELRGVIENAVEIARPVIDSRGHRFTVELPPQEIYLTGDETRLAQVFSNLLNNAAKYTQPGGDMALRAEVAADEVRVTIADNGMGIAPDVLPRLFEMFTQGDAAVDRTVQSGLGVGLALSRHLVRMHGGSIEAFSAGVGRGSRFTVRLPIASRHDAAAPGASARDETRQPTQRILVVDDNQDFATSLAMILRDLGHEVRVEHDGIAGVAAAEAFQPRIAFVDIGMPGMSGYDVARTLRANTRTGAIVLVAITGFGQETDKLRTQEAGFDHHIVKPIDPATLPALLHEIASTAADRRTMDRTAR
ncbi:MAG TPA: ATP-binding protein [Burkholderiales bacterium]|nr:ATP-binding protein [Burkholderiales bacterium]